jgi:recombination protein RecT
MSDESQNPIARPTGSRRVTPVDEFRDFLRVKESALAQYVTNGLKPEALIRFALLDYSTNEKLQACTRQSLYLALIACAVTGLEPGGLRGEAYLVPYGKEATFVPGYKGLIKLARRSRGIRKLSCNVVYDGDFFDYDVGTSAFVKHKPTLGDRGDIIAAYAAAELDDGALEVELMPFADLEKVRKASKGGPAWRDWEDQMYRKAPIRRLCKRLPLGSDYFIAQALDTHVDQGELAQYRNVIDVATDGEAERSDKAEEASARAEELRRKMDGNRG